MKGNKITVRRHTLPKSMASLFIFSIIVTTIFYASISSSQNKKPLHNGHSRRVSLDAARIKCRLKMHPCPKTCIVTVEDGGRLGNKLGEYASALAVAERLKLQAYIPFSIFEELGEYFAGIQLPIRECTSHCHKKCPGMRTLNEPGYFLQGAPFNATPFLKSLHLPPFAFMPQYFVPLRGVLLQHFRFRDKYLEKAQMILHRAAITLMPYSKSAARSNVTFVGIHVRRTDYEMYMRLRQKTMVVRDFFLKAMEYFRHKYPQLIVFVVASDDIEWCRANIRGKDVFYASDANSDPGTDLAVLSLCHHSIFDYGTYGFWGAFLAGGEMVVADSPGLLGQLYEYIFHWKLM